MFIHFDRMYERGGQMDRRTDTWTGIALEKKERRTTFKRSG